MLSRRLATERKISINALITFIIRGRKIRRCTEQIMIENGLKFENAVRDYLAGKLDWDSVHELALMLESENQIDFPPEIRRPLEELHLIFLTADSKDDPQFRADRQDIANLLAEIDSLKSDARRFGSRVIVERERAIEEERERSHRLKYLEKQQRKHRK